MAELGNQYIFAASIYFLRNPKKTFTLEKAYVIIDT